jgi:hypothetical protein
VTLDTPIPAISGGASTVAAGITRAETSDREQGRQGDSILAVADATGHASR